MEDLFDPRKIEKTWALENVTQERVLQQNEDRLVVLFNSDQGKFVCKTASPWKTAVALEKDTTVFQFLLEQNFSHAPKFLLTKSGKRFAELDSRLVYLMEYVEGKKPEATVETYQKLGAMTAELHLLENYPHKTDFDPAIIIATNFPDNAKKPPFGEEYLKVAATLPNFSVFSQTLIHTDIAPANAIEKADGSLTLIDWDDAGVGSAVLDLGYPLLSQFTTEDLELRPELARAFYGAYLAKREITATEKKVLFSAGLFFALMYLIYGDTTKRWERLNWALKHREEIEGMIP
ncbi:MAG: phosphotransferase [Patescibacteria group bacterium]